MVFIRSLTSYEGKKIQNILRSSRVRSRIRRAQVLLLSDQGMSAREIAKVTYLHEEYVRELIRQFNREGLKLLKERPRPGRPGKFSPEDRAEMVESAKAPPRLLGQPFSHWSIEKLRAYLIKARVVKSISIETLRTILKEEKVSLQRTKTWKESNDPEFEPKKKRLKRLYKQASDTCHIVCFDEFGPIELRPQHGSTWTPRRHPDRLPATYTRPHGVRHFLAFYDVGRDVLWGRFYARKRWSEVLDALRTLRRRYPKDETIYLVLDNFSPHKRKEILRWAKANKVKLVWTPTNASWLNRIECQFTEFRKFVFHNTYYKTHSSVKKASFKFLRYRNHRQKRKRKIKQGHSK